MKLLNRSTLLMPVILLLSIAGLACGQSAYEYGPNSQRQEGVPQGKVSQHRWENSNVFPGTERDYWIYVPAQYDASKPTVSWYSMMVEGMFETMVTLEFRLFSTT